MRKIIILVCFLWPVAHLHAQPNMEIKMSIKEDTARSFFNHILCTVAFNYPDSLVLVTEPNRCYIEGRVIGQEKWVAANINEGFRDAMIKSAGEEPAYSNLCDVFSQTDSLAFAACVEGGCAVEFRYHLLGYSYIQTLDSILNYGLFLSNLDTVYVPPATVSDVEEFNYFNTHIISKRRMIYLTGPLFSTEEYEHLQFIADKYDGVMADISKYYLILKYWKQNIVSGVTNTTAKQKVIEDLTSLLQSTKSEYLRMRCLRSLDAAYN
jgi:hypothetical protein